MTQFTFPPSVGSTLHTFHIPPMSGVYFQPDVPYPKKILIYYHGWSSSVEGSLFRAQVLAMRGHTVVVPEVPFHGVRNPINHSDQAMATYFWEVVMTAVAEFDMLVQRIQDAFGVSIEQIGVVGHSMGGYIVAGLLTRYPGLRLGVSYNASFNWKKTNEDALAYYQKDNHPSGIPTPMNGFNTFDPMDDVTALADRAIYLTNGEMDLTVPMDGNRLFMEKIAPFIKDPLRIRHQVYENLGHFVNDHMLEDGLNFIETYL